MTRTLQNVTAAGIVMFIFGFIGVTPAFAEQTNVSQWATEMWNNVKDVWQNFLGKLVALIALVATVGFLMTRRFMEAGFAFLAFLLSALTSNILQQVFGTSTSTTTR